MYNPFIWCKLDTLLLGSQSLVIFSYYQNETSSLGVPPVHRSNFSEVEPAASFSAMIPERDDK